MDSHWGEQILYKYHQAMRDKTAKTYESNEAA